MGKGLRENAPARSEEADITQFLSHKSTPLSTFVGCVIYTSEDRGETYATYRIS